jgi:hypothetical protein
LISALDNDRITRRSGDFGLAEAGQAGQPAPVWFYAGWRHICWRLKPKVAGLRPEFEGKVMFVRLAGAAA